MFENHPTVNKLQKVNVKNSFQVAVTPVLYSTTDAARTRFSPLERGCYFEGELSLAYLPKVC